MINRHALTVLLGFTLSLGPGRAGGAPGASVLLGPPPNSASASALALTTDRTGAPMLAWIERAGHNQLRVARWDGGRWQSLGGVVNENPNHNASQITARTAPGGTVWLGWGEDSAGAHTDSYLLSSWSGQQWSDPSRYAIRRDLSDAGRSRAFTVLPDGRPFIAWTNIYDLEARSTVVQPFSWQGDRWDQRARPLNRSLQRASFYPSTDAANNGDVYVTWLEGDVARSEVVVSVRRGATWTPLGPALNGRPNTYTFSPLLRVGPEGRPTVTWLEDRGGIDTVFAKRWTGTAWQALGGALNVNAASLAEAPSLALDRQGRAVVAWAEGNAGSRRVYARRWTGAGWAALGDGALNLDAHRDAASAAVTIDGQGRVVVAWREGAAQGYAVHVRRFE